MIILDTNVVSEVMRPSPSARVLRWLAAQRAGELFITTITQAEILFGVELLPVGKRRVALQSAVAAMLAEDFAGRILPFDGDAAGMYARIAAERRALERPISQLDAQVAAIARSRGAAVASRNASDFEHCGVAVIDPWRGRSP